MLYICHFIDCISLCWLHAEINFLVTAIACNDNVSAVQQTTAWWFTAIVIYGLLILGKLHLC